MRLSEKRKAKVGEEEKMMENKNKGWLKCEMGEQGGLRQELHNVKKTRRR